MERHTLVSKRLPMAAVMAMAPAPHTDARTAARHMGAPPAHAPVAPSIATKRRNIAAIPGTRTESAVWLLAGVGGATGGSPVSGFDLRVMSPSRAVRPVRGVSAGRPDSSRWRPSVRSERRSPCRALALGSRLVAAFNLAQSPLQVRILAGARASFSL